MCPLLCREVLYTPRIGFILSARARFVWEATVTMTHQAGAQQTRGRMISKARERSAPLQIPHTYGKVCTQTSKTFTYIEGLSLTERQK